MSVSFPCVMVNLAMLYKVILRNQATCKSSIFLRNSGCVTIVHFKRLGSRHIHKEIEISECVFGFNEILCETGLIQTLTHNCNIKEELFEAI